MASLALAVEPFRAARIFKSSLLKAFSSAFLDASACSCFHAWKSISTISSFLPEASRLLLIRAFLRASTDITRSSLRLLLSASSCCFFNSASFLRCASLLSNASTRSPLTGFSSSTFLGAKWPALSSAFSSRSTMTSLTNGLRLRFLHCLSSSALSRATSAASCLSRTICSKALSTPPSCCHCCKSFSTRVCFGSVPVMPWTAQSSFSSGALRASSSSFFCTTTARIWASRAFTASRSDASCSRMA
mmetsp:Transcript_97042/g.230936  ORF Transcript_97042/g.230936 Transcript_97042/m.230936 type:complete len:246 (-) Transcript_97042:329-1066(-)